MPWPVYSERFLLGYQQPGLTTYPVPAGRRLVLTDITFVNAYKLAGTCQVFCGGLIIYSHAFLASQEWINEAVRIPMYVGEVLGMYLPAAEFAGVLSGYLLSETTLRNAPPPSTYPSVLDPGQELPVGGP